MRWALYKQGTRQLPGYGPLRSLKVPTLSYSPNMISTALVSLVLANAAGAVSSFDPLQHLAGIAPYFEDPVLDPKPPQGCNVTRAA